MFSGQPLTWRLVALGGIIACLFVELSFAQIYILPLLMLWFINVFSAMGSREHQQGVLVLISTTPNGRLRQILCSWAAGILLALMLALPLLARMAMAGQAGGLLACLAGVVFLPSLALFSGEITKTPRVFEAALVVITYLVINGAAPLMYLGAPPDTLSLPRAGIYLALGLGMATAAVLKRTKSS
jgi:hypothetical protein